MPSNKTMVALLRGINVGKAKRIAMADLRLVVEGLGYVRVRTLLNSGNVVFSGTAVAPEKGAARIERAIAEKLGVFSRVTVITAEEVGNSVENNPLAAMTLDHSRLLIAVVAELALMNLVMPLAQEVWSPEAMAAGDRLVWVWSPKGVLESKVLAALNRLLKDSVTVRNLATMIKLDAMCREN